MDTLRYRNRLASRGLAIAAGLFLLASGPATLAHEVLAFDKDVRPILERSCGGTLCHVGQKVSGVDLTDYRSTMASVGDLYRKAIVQPLDPDGSPLLDKLMHDQPAFGERMPTGGPYLGAVEIAVVTRWIAEGARRSHLPLRGDTSGDDTINVTDPIMLVFHLFVGGPGPRCRTVADADSSDRLDLNDVVFVLNYLFLGTEAPGPVSEEEAEACRHAGELSFASIYQKVFAPSCSFSSCHSALSQKGDLSFETAEESHRALVGVASFNEAARAEGLLRVDPGKPETSFLWKKLTTPGPGEGNRMPPTSSTGLSPSILAAIREWILAGAPLEGTIAGVPDLGDEPLPPIDRIPAPPRPENGVQIHLAPFLIGAGREREIFSYLEKPFASLPADPVIERIDIHMSEESHHFILYEYIASTRPSPGLRDGAGFVDLLGAHRYTVASQQSFFSLAFPPGVGIKFSRNASFDMNSHYVNLNSQQDLLGEVYVNFFLAEPGSVTTLVKPIFDVNTDIRVPPNQTATTDETFPSLSSALTDPALGVGGRVSRETHIYSLSTHTHRHGIRFQVFRAGTQELVHDNLDWDDPLYQLYDPPLVLRPGQGLRYVVTHRYHDPPSATAPALTFGPSAEDEMAILLGYYAIK